MSDKFQYTATLSVTLKECVEALRLFKRIQKDELPLNIVEKFWALRLIADALILKLAKLFDRTKNVISFEKLPIDLKLKLNHEDLQNYKEKLRNIKASIQQFLDQVENNRDKRIAHLQKVQQLGWTKDSYEIFFERSGYISSEKIQPVEMEFEFLVPENLPIEQIEATIRSLEDLIFYQVLYPKPQASVH